MSLLRGLGPAPETARIPKRKPVGNVEPPSPVEFATDFTDSAKLSFFLSRILEPE